jgi:fermentation-respiration switch protein FrsA (DUF1100 family)
VILLEVVFLVIFWSWVFSALLFLRNTLLPRLPVDVTPAAGGLAFAPVQFPATDGVRLEGWKIPGRLDHPWLIMCHGVGSNRTDLLEIAVGLHEGGFNLFLFDFRAHGGSEGRSTSFGWLEQRDLEGAVAFLGQQPEVPARPYGIYGISMGAAVAIMVAARDERLAAVAADSPYTDLEDSIGRHLRLLYPVLPKQPFLWFVLATYRLRFGAWPGRVSPRTSAAGLSPRALLLMNGADDPRMPAGGAEEIFASAREPRELWLIRGAGHLEGFALNPAEYKARLVRFFKAGLE